MCKDINEVVLGMPSVALSSFGFNDDASVPADVILNAVRLQRRGTKNNDQRMKHWNGVARFNA